MGQFASGRFAWAICDDCGLRYRYTELRAEPRTGMRKCHDCVDQPYPYWAFTRPPDPEALRFARPDRISDDPGPDPDPPPDPDPDPPDLGFYVSSTSILISMETALISYAGPTGPQPPEG